MKFFKNLNTLLFMLWIVTESSGQEIHFLSLGTDTLHIIDQEILIRFQIDSGFHIQSDQPDSDLMIPSRLVLQFADGSTGNKGVYSESHSFILEGTKHQVFSDSLSIKVPLNQNQVSAEWVDLEFYYQACDSRKCYFPRIYSRKMRLRPEQ